MFMIFEKLGGREAAIEALKAEAGKEGWPTIHTLKSWRKHRELPGPVVKQLMKICDERGIDYQASDFVAPPKNHQ